MINSLVFEDEPIKVMKQYNNNESLDKILELIQNFIMIYNDFQSFDDYMAQNIYDILNYIRYNYNYRNQEEKNKKYECYRICISQLNNRLQVNSEEFYMSQFLARGMNFDYIKKLGSYMLPDTIKENIRASLCFDKFFYDILTKNPQNVSNSELSILIMNTMFIYSTNYFYLECPDILNNNFILKQVLMENKKILTNNKLKNHDYEITKSLKKCNKYLLKEIRWS